MLPQTTFTLAVLALSSLVSLAPLPALSIPNALLSRSADSSIKPGSYRIPLKPMRRASSTVIQQQKRSDNSTAGSSNSTDSGLGDEGVQDDMVDGGADFLYAGIIGFGHPDVQELYIQLDTGSSLLAVYGEEFEKNYPNAGDGTSRGAPFVLSKTNATDLGIKAKYRYADTTYFNASIYQDDLIVGGFKLDDQPFALMTAGNFSTPGSSVSGILGLGWSTMNAGITPSRTNTTPAVEQLWRSGALKEPLFSFSMLRNKVKDNVTSLTENEGGVFTLGELDSDLYSGDVSWKPLVYETPYSTTKPSSWHSQVDSLTVNGKQIVGTENMTTLFDTGSAAISLPVEIVQAIYANTPDMLINESGDFVKCPLPFAGPSPLNLTVTYGGQDFPVLFEDIVAARVNTTDGVLACQIQIARSDHAVMGAGFLKNIFSAYRFDPPSIGLAHLSQEFLSENPKAGSSPAVMTADAAWGTPSPIPSPTLSAHEFDTEKPITATATQDLIQTTSFSLSVQPTAAGTTTIGTVAPFATGAVNSKGQSSNSSSSGAGAGAGAGAGSASGQDALGALMSSLSGGSSGSSNSSSGGDSGSSLISSILSGLSNTAGSNASDTASSGSSPGGLTGNGSGSSDIASILGSLSNSTENSTDSSSSSSGGSSDIASILNSLSGSSNSTSADSSSSSSAGGADISAILNSLSSSSNTSDASSSSGGLGKRAGNGSNTTSSSSNGGLDLGSLLKGMNCTSNSGNHTTSSSASAYASKVCGALNSQASNSTSNSTSESAEEVFKSVGAVFQKILGELESTLSPSNSASA